MTNDLLTAASTGLGLKIAADIKTDFMTDKKHDQPLSQPDPETTHTTDPQEHMEGPFSSAMQGLKHNAEKADHPNTEDRTEENPENEQRTAEDRDQAK